MLQFPIQNKNIKDIKKIVKGDINVIKLYIIQTLDLNFKRFDIIYQVN